MDPMTFLCLSFIHSFIYSFIIVFHLKGVHIEVLSQSLIPTHYTMNDRDYTVQFKYIMLFIHLYFISISNGLPIIQYIFTQVHILAVDL